MNRRNFLGLVGTIVLSEITRQQAANATTVMAASGKKRIAVIGAGLAGLSAARQLRNQGHDVVVIEARDRIGGRIWTSTKWADAPIDLGATWIHGSKGNPITEIAQSIRAKRLSTNYDDGIAYNTDGEALTDAQEKQLEELRDQIYESLEAAQKGDEDSTIQEVIDTLVAKLEPSPETLRYIRFILSSEIEQEYSGSVEELSALWFDDAKDFPGGDVLFVDGYRVITEYLARNLKIELGQTVKEIQWEQTPISIVTDKTTFTADRVLVTLPLGVLKAGNVRFTPELPSANRTAIATLGMGVLNKCYLRFATAFWPTDVDWIEYVSEKHGEWTEWVSFMKAAKLPILLGFNAAKRGREIEAWSDAEIIASAMQTLRTLYGPDIPEPIDYQITRWASDPFALGSYSYNPVGAEPQVRKDLAKPVNKKIFFAGEATESKYFSTAHGAYLSGLRAAKEVASS